MWKSSSAQETTKKGWKWIVTLTVLNNVATKYPLTKDYTEQNMKEVCEREHITVEEVIYFIVFV